jgi:hypothetical protein
MFEMTDEISATEFREALSTGDSIKKFLPDCASEVFIRELFA